MAETLFPFSMSAVIAATNLNPSIFSQLWLIKEQIFKEEDFLSLTNQAFTPLAAQFQNENIEFLVIPERIQITLRKVDEASRSKFSEFLTGIIGKVVEKLPHTPYKAIGFNMDWRIGKFDSEVFGRSNRNIFLKSEKSFLGENFKEPNSRFGSYLSKDFGMGRLRLTITPLRFTPKDGQAPFEGLNLNFNFNLDLLGEDKERIKKIHDYIHSWNESYAFAEKISNGLNSELK